MIYDEVQYTRRDWWNRNLIKSNDGLKCLTIPVIKDDYYQKISDTKILQCNLLKKHKSYLQASYGKSSYFKDYKDSIFEIYDSAH